MKLLLVFLFIFSVGGTYQSQNTIIRNYENQGLEGRRYKPDWKDLDTRPLPEWYDRAKVGIFLHWGVFSVPSYKNEWFWRLWKQGDKDIEKFMRNNYPPGFTYQDFAPRFTVEFFNPDYWADLFKNAGAKYVVLTTKHHEGFTLFPSKRSFGWNSGDVGPNRDLTGDLAKAVRNKGLIFGAYHSLMEWYNPMYINDKNNQYASQTFVKHKLRPDLEQLINDYEPSILWSDGDWEDPDTYWNSTHTLAWLYNDSPVKDIVVTNDRWGKGLRNKHGDFYTGQDHYHPDVLQNHKWEDAFTIANGSWGYRRDMTYHEVWSTKSIIETVVTAVSCGGNALINVGPTKEGTIAPIFEERLLELGAWLEINGEAIYNTSPWYHQMDSANNRTWYTCTKNKYNASNPTAIPQDSDTVTAIYAIFLDWPANNILKIKNITSTLQNGLYRTALLGQEDKILKWSISSDGVTNIDLPDMSTVKSKNVWTLKFTDSW